MDAIISEMDEFRSLLAEDDKEGLKEKMRLSTRRHAFFIQ
jgi:hypothetical protein